MHSCPNCGQACYCSGDIEDHDTGEEYTCICTCCDRTGESDGDDDGWDGDISHIPTPKEDGGSPSPTANPNLVWVIGRGWIDADIIEQEQADAAILEAMKGDDLFQNYFDLLP